MAGDQANPLWQVQKDLAKQPLGQQAQDGPADPYEGMTPFQARQAAGAKRYEDRREAGAARFEARHHQGAGQWGKMHRDPAVMMDGPPDPFPQGMPQFGHGGGQGGGGGGPQDQMMAMMGRLEMQNQQIIELLRHGARF